MTDALVDLFRIPLGVHQVVAGNLDIYFACLLGVDHLDEFCRRTAPQLVGADFRARQNDGTGGYDGPLAYLGIVHNHGTHADQGEVVDFGTVYGHIMTD